MRIAELLSWAGARAQVGQGRDMEILLGHVVGVDSRSLIGREREQVDAASARRFRELVRRRREGCPVAYLVRSRSFWSLDLFVDERVLIPRHETETLVECVLQCVRGRDAPDICDLGTGSGAVALSLAAEMPAARVLATDISREALDVAAVNAGRQDARNVRFLESDWYAGLQPSAFDLICSNPPYVAAADPHLAVGDVRFEPKRALVPGPGGLEALKTVIRGAPAHLRRAGWLFVEHGFDQGAAVRALYGSAGFADISTIRDLGGMERVTSGRWAGAGETVRT